jgi:hypothetical protein
LIFAALAASCDALPGILIIPSLEPRDEHLRHDGICALWVAIEIGAQGSAIGTVLD